MWGISLVPNIFSTSTRIIHSFTCMGNLIRNKGGRLVASVGCFTAVF